MSCNSNCYLPIPPRAWSRVQNSCSLFDENTYSGEALVPLPYSGKLVPASVLYLEYAMLNKGNVLQYKKNSSNLTKQQRYAQIAKGKWVNRNTTWATQSTRGYTNPNNQSLQRVNTVNITLDGQPTLAPITCPTPTNIVNQPLPGTSSSGANPEVIPPPPPPPTVNTGTELPPTIIETPILPIVIQDLGNLICGTQENVCTGEIIRQPTDVICHPTSDSDVPGPITELCWNDGNPTWYPRQRYVMTNSGNKWPVNATLLSSIRPLPADIISISNVENVVTLIWTFDPKCLPVNDFIIYENGIPIQIVSGNSVTTTFTVENCATYTFYIVGTNGTVVSDPSNSVSITVNNIITPIIVSCETISSNSQQIIWTGGSGYCLNEKYNIYLNNTLLVSNITGFSYTFINLTICDTYNFGVQSTLNSETSNIIYSNNQILWPAPPINLSYILLSSTSIRLSWEIDTLHNCSPATSYTIYYNSSSITISAPNTTYDLSGLISNTLYNISITSINIVGVSLPSSTLTVTTNSIPFTITGGTSTYIGGYYYIPFTSTESITFINNLQNIYVAIVGGGGGGGWKNLLLPGTPFSCGGGGGGQALIPYSIVLTNTIFTITLIGLGGNYGASPGSSGSPGTSTSFTDYTNNYTVTGGDGGSFSNNIINTLSGTYTGPGTSPTGNPILSGTGGYGGHGQDAASVNNAVNGENSYFLTTNPGNINTLYSLGGGGGGCNDVGGEGGSVLGAGGGGTPSNSFNLNTQDASGYGAGGGSYYTGSINVQRPGNGSQGICIIFFQF